MNKKVIDIINDSSDLNYNIDSKSEYIINIFNEKQSDMNISIKQTSDSNLIINYFSLIDKNVNINIYDEIEENNNKCVINFNAIAKSGYGNINVTVKANEKTKGNIIIEDLKGINEEGSVCFMPVLEVDTNEVDASHFATVGGIDKDKLFYLESKGICKTKAYEMLKDNFIYSIFSKEFINKLNERRKVNE